MLFLFREDLSNLHREFTVIHSITSAVELEKHNRVAVLALAVEKRAIDCF